jgi:hypothetical protein
MVKAIMMLQHGRVLPNANFERLNENIEGREKLKVRYNVFLLPIQIYAQ